MSYNNKDGEVITKKCDKGTFITYVDFNDYIKQERALRKYFMKAYKELTFEVSKKIRETKEDGDYEIELYTDNKFKKVYGQIKVRFYKQNNVIVMKEIHPRETLLNLHSVLAKAYKGVPYTNEKELLRIKIILGG